MSRRVKRTEKKEKDEEDQKPNQACPYDKILSYKKLGGGSFEFFVKRQGKAYRESEWVTSDQLQKYAFGQTLINRFKKSSAGLPTEEPYYDPNFDIVDRIIGKKGKKFEVKWMNLGYDDVTVESDLPEWAMEEYKARQKQIFPGTKQNLKAKTTLTKEIVNDYEIGDQKLKPYHITALNLLIGNYTDGLASEIIDHYNMDLYVACCAFLHILITQCNEIGPFLIVAPNSTALKWYNTIR